MDLQLRSGKEGRGGKKLVSIYCGKLSGEVFYASLQQNGHMEASDVNSGCWNLWVRHAYEGGGGLGMQAIIWVFWGSSGQRADEAFFSDISLFCYFVFSFYLQPFASVCSLNSSIIMTVNFSSYQ